MRDLIFPPLLVASIAVAGLGAGTAGVTTGWRGGVPPSPRLPIVIPVPIGCPGPAMPLPTPPPPPANPGAAGGATYQVCPRMVGRVPMPVQQFALANPHAIPGYGELRNPSVPAGPWNPLRTWLELRDVGKPFSKCNSIVWKAGCY